MNVVVTGMGLLCSLGSLTESWQALMVGKSGIQLYQPYPELPQRPLAIIHNRPALLNELTLRVVAAALEDAGLAAPLPECGIVIGSSRSFQALWEQLAAQRYDKNLPASLSLEHWLETLPHQAAIAAAHQVGATGPVLAPMAACATGIWAIARGFELIQGGQCQRVLVGALEAPITPLTLAGFEQIGALGNKGCYPFDKQREGMVLGEGGAVLVLESQELALNRGAKIYGQVLGFGLTDDAYHVSTPEPTGKSAIAAVRQCLQRSQLDARQIDYIHAHGTGTKLNDEREARIIEHLFPQGVAVSSTKGATGHTLGASGAIGAAFCLLALQYQQLPPCVGLREPAFALDLVTQSRQTKIEQVLGFSFGFGGQNAVIALQKWEV